MAVQTSAAPVDEKQRRANLFRYGLLLIPPLAFTLAFAVPYMVTRGLGMDLGSIITIAFVPAILWAAGTGLLCMGVWWAYKRYILKM